MTTMTPAKHSVMIRQLSGIVLGIIFGFFLGASCVAENINGVDFDVVYRPHVFPEQAVPPWKRVGRGQRELVTVDGQPTLQMTSEPAGTDYYEISDLIAGETPNFLESGKGLTMECSLRVDSQDGNNGAIAIRVSDKNWLFILQCDRDGIWPYKRLKEKVPLSLSEKFHQLRLVVPPEGDVLSVYVDGNPEALLRILRHANKEDSQSHIAWGDMGASMGGQSTWQYFAFTTHGAFPPIKP